jgi:3-oxoacyl-[acyl-carrier-protein] synthase II
MPQDLVISGLGLTTAFGAGPREFFDGLLAGGTALAAAGIAPDAETVCARAAAPDGDGPRRARLLQGALRQALAPAGSDTHGAWPAPSASLARTLLVVVGQSPRVSVPDADAAEVAGGWPEPAHTGGFAEVVFLSQACASILFGIGFARDWIRAGLGEAALVAGAFTLNRYEYLGMSAVGALSGAGARPFDLARDGTSLGEGAAAILLEPRERAHAAGRPAQARVAGLCCRISGRRLTDSDPTLLAECMHSALAEAGTARPGYVHAHATGTPQGDLAERDAIDLLGARHGWREVPVGAHKGAIGHLMHVSGGAAVAAGLGALSTGTAPGTARLDAPLETSGAISLLREPRALPRIETVLVNSFGFAGNTASLVLAAP